MFLIAASLTLFFLAAFCASQRFREMVARHRLGIAVVLLGLAGVVVFAFVVTDFLLIDACLDNGGRWDKERNACQFRE